MDLFITCGHNLEMLLAQELAQMGYPQAVTGFRGVHIRNTERTAIYRINYLSRIASRVLVPLARFKCRDDKSLYKGVQQLNWTPYFPNMETFSIDANVTHSVLRNSLYAIQVAKDAICDQLRQRTGQRPQIDTKQPAVQLNLFINDTSGIISFDTSGMPLHKRGYRQESIEAPLQENLAAALLILAGYQGNEKICDPCCGAGTILIEAALIASKTPPGFLRTKWGFLHMPEHSQDEWLKIKNEADQKREKLPEGHFFGNDLSKQAIHACKTNLRATGFHQAVQIVQNDIREYRPLIAPNFVITNPPYGMRLDDIEHLRPLYRAIGDFMKRQTEKPAKGFVFTGSAELSKEIGLATSKRHVLNNGGIDSRLLEFDLY